MSKFVEEIAYLERSIERYEERVERNKKLLESVDNPLLDRKRIVERVERLEERLELYKNELKKLVE